MTASIYGLTTVLLILGVCALGAYAARLARENDELRAKLHGQAKLVRRQSEALEQTQDGLDPGRELASDFGPGRKNMTAFFAEWGRVRLLRTDISELQYPTDE